MTLDEYTEWYAKRPLWWRIKNDLSWRLRSIWAAIVRKPGPGELFLLHAYQREQRERLEQGMPVAMKASVILHEDGTVTVNAPRIYLGDDE